MDNEMNAFSAGVEPGGLRNKTQIRILIVFLVNAIHEPVAESVVIEALQTHGLANYFEATQALDELLDNKSVISSDSKLYVTPRGATSLLELAGDVPASVRETALNDAVNIILREKNKDSNTVDIAECADGWDVTFGIHNKGRTLMSLTVYAADLEQANALKENFMKNPEKVYSTVVASLYV